MNVISPGLFLLIPVLITFTVKSFTRTLGFLFSASFTLSLKFVHRIYVHFH
ncbi:Protein of unknown function [Bacillus cereus]|nr:Protein of unknown function [Bacillus cereus]SCN06104.1 Protein of unknown function [Bacillus wiedmannii]